MTLATGPAVELHTSAYHATITDYDGRIRTRDYTAAEADALIDTAQFDDDQVTPATDRSGHITITRVITSHPISKRMTTELAPAHSPRLSTRQYEDLALVRELEDRTYGAILSADRIDAGFNSIPPARSRRLFAHGWLVSTVWEENGKPVQRVTVSYAGRIAMTLYEHRTAIGVVPFRTWVNGALQGSWEDGGSQYLAWCSCDQWRTKPLVVRDVARRAARRHREEHLQAVLEWAASAQAG